MLSSLRMHSTNLPFPKKITLKSSVLKTLQKACFGRLPVGLDTTPIQYTMHKCPSFSMTFAQTSSLQKLWNLFAHLSLLNYALIATSNKEMDALQIFMEVF